MSKIKNSLSGTTPNNEPEIDRGGCTIYGENICPTLVAGYYKMFGNTQDGLTVVILEVKNE